VKKCRLPCRLIIHWCIFVSSQKVSETEFQHPVVVLAMNFNPPGENSPSLLQFTEVETLFHEMGHAMHCNIPTSFCPTN